VTGEGTRTYKPRPEGTAFAFTGHWHGSLDGGPAVPEEEALTLEFGENARFKLMLGAIEVVGAYRLDGDRLELRTQTIDKSAPSEYAAQNPARKALADRLQQPLVFAVDEKFTEVSLDDPQLGRAKLEPKP
jgi:hypothetical protein